ncbi:hypothetical protein SAMN04487996_12562 [Dyadobacter soli]|uniref:N-acetyltransferase domain-containing protein n=1 Tax=Dyadobacter soli TaxID=659014 RepID=A0A1G7Y5Y8_9BACT|nr:hypothetical protein [Dyadobacter soli]SDG91777.1 hypothetical protein SAMN04487996_12562 [Dyadobacter soli]
MGYYLDDKLTGERLPATISRLSRKEVMLVHKGNRFHFKWNKELDFEVYGLRIDATAEIVGVVSIERSRDECAVKVRLIANAKEHMGVGKRLDRIAGSLLAFVCKISFESDFDGFVCLVPKTYLIKVYREKYGFRNTGTCMFSSTDNSKILIDKYYESSDQERAESY